MMASAAGSVSRQMVIGHHHRNPQRMGMIDAACDEIPLSTVIIICAPRAWA
jgi:hypothetical protein